MKKLTVLLVVFVLSLLANTAFSQGDQKDYSLAKVGTKVYGVYVFVGAEPYYEYDYIATIKVKITWDGTKASAFEKTIKKAKKKYTNFNGMVFHSENLNKADLIRFKDIKASRGGFSLGDRVSFIKLGKLSYGKIVKLKDKACSIQVEDTGKIVQVAYSKLTIATE